VTAGQFARYRRELAEFVARLDRADLDLPGHLDDVWERDGALVLAVRAGYYTLSHRGGLVLTWRPHPGLPSTVATGPVALFEFEDLMAFPLAERVLDLVVLLDDSPDDGPGPTPGATRGRQEPPFP
jgi:hypothetical protein